MRSADDLRKRLAKATDALVKTAARVTSLRKALRAAERREARARAQVQAKLDALDLSEVEHVVERARRLDLE